MSELVRTYSVRALAHSIVSALAAEELAVLQFAGANQANVWLPILREACEAEWALEEEPKQFLHFNIEPETSLTELLEWFDVTSVEEFVAEGYSEPASLYFCEESLGQTNWREFIREIRRLSSGESPDLHERRVLITTSYPKKLEFENAAGVRGYKFWNFLTWEETRLFVSSRVGAAKNEAARLWMIATYSGASNLEPHLIEALCDQRPESLQTVRELVLSLAARSCQEAHGVGELAPEYDVKQWKVPESLFPLWADGGLFGATLDRGERYPYSRFSGDSVIKHLDMRIWEEQTAGLFPLVIQLLRTANKLIDRSAPQGWRARLAKENSSSESETYWMEVGPLFHFMLASPDRVWPKVLIDFLGQLKRVRNRLAHMEPIDMQDMEALWDRYRRAYRLSEN